MAMCVNVCAGDVCPWYVCAGVCIVCMCVSMCEYVCECVCVCVSECCQVGPSGCPPGAPRVRCGAAPTHAGISLPAAAAERQPPPLPFHRRGHQGAQGRTTAKKPTRPEISLAPVYVPENNLHRLSASFPLLEPTRRCQKRSNTVTAGMAAAE